MSKGLALKTIIGAGAIAAGLAMGTHFNSVQTVSEAQNNQPEKEALKPTIVYKTENTAPKTVILQKGDNLHKVFTQEEIKVLADAMKGVDWKKITPPDSSIASSIRHAFPPSSPPFHPGDRPNSDCGGCSPPPLGAVGSRFDYR
jgi:hypothetical protein